MQDHYSVLGVGPSANEEQIKKAFRRLALQFHPDKRAGDENKMKALNAAKETLLDTAKRKKFDLTRQRFFAASPGSFKTFSGTHDPHYQLMMAIFNNDIKRVQSLLKHKAINFNQPSSRFSGRTPLTLAAQLGKDEIVKRLLEHDAIDINYQDSHGLTPLEYAFQKSHHHIITLFLNQDCINIKTSLATRLVTIAIKNNDIECIQLLLKQKHINLKRKLPSHLTPREYAMRLSRHTIYQLIKQYEKSVRSPQKGHRESADTALFNAARTNNVQNIKDALNRNAHINCVTMRMTPLLTAVKYNNVEAVKTLLDHDAEINPKGIEAWRDVIKKVEKDGVNLDLSSKIKKLINTKENKKLQNLINKIDGKSDKVARYLVTNGPDFFNDKKNFLKKLYQNKNQALKGELLCDLLSCYFRRQQDKRKYFWPTTPLFSFTLSSKCLGIFPRRIGGCSRLEKLQAIENAIRFIIGESKDIDENNIPILKNGRTKKLVWDRIEKIYLFSQGMPSEENKAQSESFRL